MGKPIRHALGLALGIWVLAALANSAGGQASRMPSPGSGRKPNHYMGPFGQVEPGARPVEPATPQPPSPPSPTPSAENPAAGGAGSATGARAGATRSGGIGRRPRSSATGTLTPRWETWWEWNKERYLGLGRRSRPAGPETGRGPVFMGRPIGGRLSEREAFRRLQRVTVLPALRREAARGTTMLRLAAVYALGFTGEREVLPDLAAALADGSLEVREAALAALGMSGQPEAASVLTEVLRGRRPGTGDQTLCQAADRERGLAALGLGLIGAAGPIEILGKTALHRATSRELRGACLLALGLIPDAEARKWLARAAKARWCGVTERALIATALGYQGDEEDRKSVV